MSLRRLEMLRSGGVLYSDRIERSTLLGSSSFAAMSLGHPTAQSLASPTILRLGDRLGPRCQEVVRKTTSGESSARLWLTADYTTPFFGGWASEQPLLSLVDRWEE